jgi:hypothetical protein
VIRQAQPPCGTYFPEPVPLRGGRPLDVGETVEVGGERTGSCCAVCTLQLQCALKYKPVWIEASVAFRNPGGDLREDCTLSFADL